MGISCSCLGLSSNARKTDVTKRPTQSVDKLQTTVVNPIQSPEDSGNSIELNDLEKDKKEIIELKESLAKKERLFEEKLKKVYANQEERLDNAQNYISDLKSNGGKFVK
jgi:hypothetical protein